MSEVNDQAVKKRGRKPKVNAATPEDEIIEAAKEETAAAGSLFKTDENGLIDWKSMIPIKYYQLSDEWCSANGIDKRSLNREQTEEILKREGDEAKVITLYGFKYIAHLRGLCDVSYSLEKTTEKNDYVIMRCNLMFENNLYIDGKFFDGYLGPRTVSGYANANISNTVYPFDQYLESMAENRAFIRAVRTALNINIVGYEEMKERPSKSVDLIGDDELPLSPNESLQQLVESKPNGNFAKLKANLEKKGWKNLDGKNNYSDFDSSECLRIIEMIQSKS